MILSKQLKHLEKEQDEDLQRLRASGFAVLQAASPEKLVKAHPYMTIGAAVFLGMTLAPGPGKASKNGKAGAGRNRLLGFVEQILGHFVPGLNLSGAPEKATVPDSFTVTPPPTSSILDLVQVAQSLIGSLGGILPSRSTGLNAIISDCGSMDANTLKSHLVELRIEPN